MFSIKGRKPTVGNGSFLNERSGQITFDVPDEKSVTVGLCHPFHILAKTIHTLEHVKARFHDTFFEFHINPFSFNLK